MFYLKNDDMETLFRKAAEGYELGTQRASDWESVHTALHGKANVPETGKKKKKRRFIFWWLLLFPAGWMAHNTWDKNFNNRSIGNIPPVTYRQSGPAIPVESAVPDETIVFAEAEKKKGIGTLKATGKETGTMESQRHITGFRDKLGNMQDKAGESLRGLSYAPALLLQKAGTRDRVLPALTVERYIMQNAATLENGHKTRPEAATGEEVKPVLPSVKNHYFYIQALVSPDISTVKFQKTSGVGYSGGLLFGYRISNRWQVEAGALWEKKQYYTKGEYFDKSKLGQYWNNAEIYSVNGNCGMITLPVNVRYNFSSGKKANWFLAGGMSSYLMSREYYNYTYAYYGNVHTKGYTYRENSRAWLAAVNLGAGYERKIGKSFQLRAEPYFRVPVSGMGKGNLSLNSAGIFLGIGKRFH
ncbi:MAG TPA: outer membrane beta-barrel protein [Agriterribacter sp.]|nr:outer membrane beta-barrel protein [Agriterribacter sp.]